MDADLLSIQPTSAVPIYRQIVEQVQRLASAGQLRPGDTLPSVREVAAVHAINPMTVSKAYSLLEGEGVLVRQRGKGMAVAEQSRAAGSLAARLDLLDPALRTVADHARQLELPAEQVLARLAALLDEET
ncbi:GntR family transcriptional regulator [Pseudoxanthomonas sp. JBR18]|uniref:GntR family transcriptional regulator n=1 Tax=Pseudoxanthomonas sp. JBR18 TaxID=2969308 RepID=UPI002304F178|nr:GntR family transcriptional regulator [Pseudoxanthomonas sp. JBR18]WCE05767.1 GntR family transcriptional regulator [Pseudoxanthomonas sp. JBR18]